MALSLQLEDASGPSGGVSYDFAKAFDLVPQDLLFAEIIRPLQPLYPNPSSGLSSSWVDKVTPTPDLPNEQRGWSCAFCSVSLPDGLPRTVKEYAIKEHYRTKHPRRDTSLRAIHKARAKQYKKDPSLYPNILAAKKRLSTALSRFQNAAPKVDAGGHLLEVIRPNWSIWPRLKANRKRFGTMMTCVNCWRVANQDWDIPCRPEGPVSSQHKQIWKKIVKDSPDNLRTLLSTWKVTFEEADKHICPEKYIEPADHRIGGHRGERVGEARHPGPTSRRGLSTWSINTGGAKCAWAVLSDAAQKQIDVAIQELCMKPSEVEAFVTTAHNIGYSAFGQPGNDKTRPWGGAALLINRKLKSRRHSSFSFSGGQAMFVWVNGMCLVSCYCAQNEFVMDCHAEIAARIQALPTYKTWMILADWNTEFHENPAFAALQDTGPQLCVVFIMVAHCRPDGKVTEPLIMELRISLLGFVILCSLTPYIVTTKS